MTAFALAQDNLPAIGPVFIGTIFNWCLMGTLITQFYIYFLSYPRDLKALKYLVFGLCILEIIQSVFSTIYAWEMLVGRWGEKNVTASLPWSASTVPIMTGLISLIVQIFFAWRIWILRVSCRYQLIAQIMSILIVMVALLQAVSAVYGGVAFCLSRTSERVLELTDVVELWLIGSFICDILIAATMIYILAEAGRGSPWKHTTAIINKLIIHSIETGALTAACALIDLVLFELFKQTNIHQAPTLLLAKLYTNALMVSLNGRNRRQSTINQLQQQGVLSHISSLTNQFENHELSLRRGSPQHGGEERKDSIVLQMTDTNEYSDESGADHELTKKFASTV